jgi:hypothetical protein
LPRAGSTRPGFAGLVFVALLDFVAINAPGCLVGFSARFNPAPREMLWKLVIFSYKAAICKFATCGLRMAACFR